VLRKAEFAEIGLPACACPFEVRWRCVWSVSDGGGTAGYTTAMYFIVTPAVLGPVCAVLFVVAVYLCRRRQHDAAAGGPSFTVKHAPVAAARLPPSAAQYRLRAPATRDRGGGGAEGVGIDEESEMMLPVGAAPAPLFFSPPTLPVPGMNSYIRQVNGVKLADRLFSLLSVYLSVCVCVCAHSVRSSILGGYMHSLSAF